MKEIAVIYSVFGEEMSAKEIIKDLLQQKLIGCANVIPRIKSYYVWKDELQEETEVAVLFKTTLELKSKIIEYLQEKHPYDCPAIVDLCDVNSNSEYAFWLNNVTS